MDATKLQEIEAQADGSCSGDDRETMLDLVAEVRRLTAALVTARREGAEAQIAGAEAVRNAVMGYLDEIFPGGPAATNERWPHELMHRVAAAVARVREGGE